MELMDTHCHLSFDPLAQEVAAVLQRSRAAGITRWITVGTTLEDSQRCVRLAEQHEGLYATAGIHPHEAKDATAEALDGMPETDEAGEPILRDAWEGAVETSVVDSTARGRRTARRPQPTPPCPRARPAASD